ncbi:MAG: Ribonuclease H [Parcubacteria group bacterium GW2011_GWC1_45_9]|nr:MAG: Ribonuclease H [Parcubacteria group bacterium GW2011_GWB1_45_10]KKU17250.1 MAG: Ribonuclease H [Parcubacteria group bacterium GW2011_GWC1_45_9]
MNQIIIHTDGASKGNPGQASIGVAIELLDGSKKQYAEKIGMATNNEAEYRAMIFGLRKLKALLGSKKAEKTKVLLKSDSQLITSQLRGEFKVKEPEFFPFFIELWNLRQEFKTVEFETVPREKNRLADKLANSVFSQRGLW